MPRTSYGRIGEDRVCSNCPAAVTDPRRFDVCNGDADGLCAVVQWRLTDPGEAALVTGLKRDIELLQRVPAQAGDEVLVCDVSLLRNRAALDRLLSGGVRVRWFDHHEAGEVPAHPHLQAHLDARADVCTSLLVDRYLGGRWRRWALVGAYGDNLAPVADGLARTSGIRDDERARLQALGEAINYNAYGDDLADVRIAPAALFRHLVRHADPIDCIEQEAIAGELLALRAADLAQAEAVAPRWQGLHGSVVVLPDAAWSRRVMGTFAHRLAAAEPGRAHAVLRPDGRSGYVASVRAPWERPEGAEGLCRRFGGSGRASAAGIDRLDADRLAAFVDAFAAAWSDCEEG
jgi:hypothetical protein